MIPKVTQSLMQMPGDRQQEIFARLRRGTLGQAIARPALNRVPWKISQTEAFAIHAKIHSVKIANLYCFAHACPLAIGSRSNQKDCSFLPLLFQAVRL